MNTMNPTITIWNLEGSHHLVQFRHDFGNGEMLDCTVKIEMGSHTIAQVVSLVLDRVLELAAAVDPQG